MSIFIPTLLVSLALIRSGQSGATGVNKLDKTLFIPAFNYPTLIHLHSTGHGTEGLENAAYYPRYAYNHDHHEYADSLQKQTLYQNTEKRLEDILHTGGSRKDLKNTNTDEDDYSRRENNVLFFEELKPELEDLDRKYKRSLAYVPWPAMAAAQSVSSNVENRASAFNSRAVSVPFGPYTTWLPYEGPSIADYTAPKNAKMPEDTRRRRRDISTPPQKQIVRSYLAFEPQPGPSYPVPGARYYPLIRSQVYEPRYASDQKPLEKLSSFAGAISYNPEQEESNKIAVGP